MKFKNTQNAFLFYVWLVFALYMLIAAYGKIRGPIETCKDEMFEGVEYILITEEGKKYCRKGR